MAWLQVNLVDWLKWMIAHCRSEEVVDPCIVTRPSSKALKKALLTALKCLDLNSEKRPTMGQVVQMLEPDNRRPHEVCCLISQFIETYFNCTQYFQKVTSSCNTLQNRIVFSYNKFMFIFIELKCYSNCISLIQKVLEDRQ